MLFQEVLFVHTRIHFLKDLFQMVTRSSLLWCAWKEVAEHCHLDLPADLSQLQLVGYFSGGVQEGRPCWCLAIGLWKLCAADSSLVAMKWCHQLSDLWNTLWLGHVKACNGFFRWCEFVCIVQSNSGVTLEYHLNPAKGSVDQQPWRKPDGVFAGCCLEQLPHRAAQVI